VFLIKSKLRNGGGLFMQGREEADQKENNEEVV
jgi:hypothetical protein